MYQLHLVGCPSALYDNLMASWQDRIACFECTEIESLPTAITRIQQGRPDWVVYCGHDARSSWEENASPTYDEPEHVERIVRAAVESGARVAVVSSDAVFAAPKMFHEECEPPADNPRSQRLGQLEQAALAHGASHVLVVRTHAFGASASRNSFAEHIWQALNRGESIELDASSFATPIFAGDAGELLLSCCRARLHGVVHIAGAERTSPLRFAQELASLGGFDCRLVRVKASDASDAAVVVQPRETSLASRIVRHELGIALPLLRESLARFLEQMADAARHQTSAATGDALVRAA